jgi:hypothetical protein
MTRRAVLLLIVMGMGMDLLGARGASAQIYEAVGSRAQGMGGAFVAVASDSSATWWNPGALADGPFVDVAVARSFTERIETLPAARDRAFWIALGTPSIGVSYYKLRLTDVQPRAPTEGGGGGREDITAGASIRSLSVHQFGATLVQTLLPGVHAGATFSYVTGTGRTATAVSTAPDTLLKVGDELSGGHGEHHFDLAAGVLATAGAVRLGLAIRNVFEPEFGAGAWRLPRQVRAGAALDIEKAGGIPLVIAFDADAMRYRAGTGDRRVLAVGAEQWLLTRRLAIRAGARFNQVGGKERAFTGGASVGVRSGMYVEGHVVHGGVPEEQGWGVATRVTF